MSQLEEKLSEQFYRWERRGRGWQVFDRPVWPEPPFRPFYGHYLPESPVLDDGRQPTFLSSLVQKLSQALRDKPETISDAPQAEEEPEPELLIREELIELQASLPPGLKVTNNQFGQLLSGLSHCREPIAFELLGTTSRVSTQFVIAQQDEHFVQQQFQAFFDSAVFLPKQGVLAEAWESFEGEVAMVEFGLAKEFMLTLGSGQLDPLVGMIGVLSALQEEEIGLFQVIFQPARQPWSESILRSVTDAADKPFFVNRPELIQETRNKVGQPLYAAVVRIATKSPDYERTWEIARHLASSLGIFDRPGGNELIPLENNEYPYEEHEEDVLRRQSRRSGMLLTREELIGFVHLPSQEVRAAKLERLTQKTKSAPRAVRNSEGLTLGYNLHAGMQTPVALTSEQRVRHVHIIGGSGTGKSTLLFNMIRHDIEAGVGVAVFDPHGDLVNEILGIIPSNRLEDVILLDPADEEYSVGFNILSAHSDLEKNLLASDLVSVFQRLSTSWGDQMGSVLHNAILAFLESSQGGTIADLRRFLIEPDFREKFLETVRDPDIIYYWKKGFAQLTGNKSIGPILTRLEVFLSPKPIRYMVSQPGNRLDFSRIMDTRGIFLANLSQGLLGKENSFLLGTLLVSKFQQLAMARQRQSLTDRQDFTIFIDEFHNFITPSMAEILSGARKYRMGLVLAHQELRQLQRDSEVASAVLSNSGTRICFRVGDDDARKLSDGFSFFEARDLQNLETGEAICRVERSDFDFNLRVTLPTRPPQSETTQRREEVIAASRKKYGTARIKVEAELYKYLQSNESNPEKQAPKELPPKCTSKVADPVPQLPISTLTPILERSEAEKPTPFQKPKILAEKTTVQPSTPPDLGRGGAQHQAVQKRIKDAAEVLGFKSTIEKQILEGQGSVDLLLERSDCTIACEISFTTTIDHEFRNVTKCLKAGFSKVAVICTEEERLKKIASAVASSLGSEISGQVIYIQPDQFIAYLKTLESRIPNSSAMPKTRRGYKIKRSGPNLTPEEYDRHERAAMRTIAESMRKKKMGT